MTRIEAMLAATGQDAEDVSRTLRSLKPAYELDRLPTEWPRLVLVDMVADRPSRTDAPELPAVDVRPDVLTIDRAIALESVGCHDAAASLIAAHGWTTLEIAEYLIDAIGTESNAARHSDISSALSLVANVDSGQLGRTCDALVTDIANGNSKDGAGSDAENINALQYLPDPAVRLEGEFFRAFLDESYERDPLIEQGDHVVQAAWWSFRALTAEAMLRPNLPDQVPSELFAGVNSSTSVEDAWQQVHRVLSNRRERNPFATAAIDSRLAGIEELIAETSDLNVAPTPDRPLLAELVAVIELDDGLRSMFPSMDAALRVDSGVDGVAI